MKKKKKNIKKVLSREEMMLRGRPIPTAEVYVESLKGYVEMQNVTFPRLCAVRRGTDDPDMYSVAIVAEVCTELTFDDVLKLQENPAIFSELFTAVQKYLGGGFSDAEIKN